MEFEHYILKGFMATRWDKSVIGFIPLRAIDLSGSAVSDVGFKLPSPGSACKRFGAPYPPPSSNRDDVGGHERA